MVARMFIGIAARHAVERVVPVMAEKMDALMPLANGCARGVRRERIGNGHRWPPWSAVETSAALFEKVGFEPLRANGTMI